MIQSGEVFYVCVIVDADMRAASQGTYLKWTTARWQFAMWDDCMLSTTLFDRLSASKENNQQLPVMVDDTLCFYCC